MRILYDGNLYASQMIGGVNRYFSNIIARLPKYIYPTLTSFYCKDKTNYPSHPNLKLREFHKFRPQRISYKVSESYFRWLNSYQKFDIAHPTYYFPLTQQPFSKYTFPLVITVHDMIHEIFSDSMDPQGYTILKKREAIEAADTLICVSKNTKNDLLKCYPHVADKVVVIYEASELCEQQSYGTEPVPARRYFLYVGSRTKVYKNFDTLLIAFAKAFKINPDILLCVVGAPFNDFEQQMITELGLVDRIQHYHYASDTHLAKLYRCSVAFVYPSLYEGFGIPPLEAMACGTVVIASNSSSVPEVVGDAGILFEPKSVSHLTDILLNLLDSPIERDRLIEKGKERSQKFSWDETAAQTLMVYRSLVN
jgi:glycosyltransferase involved in cell wall biosynthesis